MYAAACADGAGWPEVDAWFLFLADVLNDAGFTARVDKVPEGRAFVVDGEVVYTISGINVWEEIEGLINAFSQKQFCAIESHPDFMRVP